MPPDVKDMARLWDMLEAAKSTLEFTADMNFDAFLHDRRTRYAVERSLEIVGEAPHAFARGARNAFDARVLGLFGHADALIPIPRT